MTSQIQLTNRSIYPDPSPELVAALLNQSINMVVGYARAKYGDSLFEKITHEPSGIRARSLDVSPIELCTINVHYKDGTFHSIGTIIPEATHLGPLKTTEQLQSELKQLIDNDQIA